MYKNYISLPFDDLLSEYLINFDSSSAGIDWITKDLISLRKRIKSGTISLEKWNLVLQGAFLKVGIPLYHNYAFSVVLESRDINYLERLGRIIFGIFEFKRKALAIPCELQDEIIYGLTNNNDAYIQMWNFNRQIDEHGEERYQIRKKTPNSENLKIAVVCFDKIFKIEVDLSNNIQQVIRSLEKIVDVAYHQNSACKTGGNELTYLTYLPRPEFMDILKRDDQLKQAWLKIQNCDFAVSIFPDIRSDDLNHADPVQGAMAFLRHTPKGGILGDKNTLACFADSLACFVFDHVTIDGSPATWFASQIVQISNRISCYENRPN